MFPIPVALAMLTQVSGIMQSGEVVDKVIFVWQHSICLYAWRRSQDRKLA